MAEPKDSDNQAVVPETQPAEADNQYPIETAEETDVNRSWPMLAALAVAALAFAVLVVLAGRWAYNHWHHKGVSTTASTSSVAQRPNFDNSGSNPASKGGGSGSPSSGSSSNNNQGKTGTTPSQLPNNGPGDVVALFIATSLLAYVLHFTLSRRAEKQP